MKTENIRILIVGRNGSSNLCMARAFGQAGYEVEVLRIFQTKPKALNLMRFLEPERHSRFVCAYHVCICHRQNSRIAEKLLSLAKQDKKMLLVPACDMAASAADEYYDQLLPHYLLPSAGGKAGGINRLMDKELQLKLAQEAGLQIPNSCLIRAKDGVFDIPESVAYPCFIKPNISKDSDKTKLRKCSSEAELRAALTAFSQGKEIEMLVEDFLDIQREYVLLGLSTKSGTVCPGFYLKEQDGHEDRKGVTMVGKLLPVSQQPELIENIIRFVASLDYEGLFDAEVIEAQDGSWYFVELNLRYGASGCSVVKGGVNLPGMLADYMIQGKSVDLNCKITQEGKRFVSEKILLDEYSRGCMTLSQVKDLMNQADIHFIPDAEDPAPYRHFKKFYLFGAATRILFRLKALLKKHN